MPIRPKPSPALHILSVDVCGGMGTGIVLRLLKGMEYDLLHLNAIVSTDISIAHSSASGCGPVHWHQVLVWYTVATYTVYTVKDKHFLSFTITTPVATYWGFCCFHPACSSSWPNCPHYRCGGHQHWLSWRSMLGWTSHMPSGEWQWTYTEPVLLPWMTDDDSKGKKKREYIIIMAEKVG